MNDAGLRIKNRRIELGMTQEELAKKVGYSSRVSICKIETERDMPVKKLKPIADALEISVAELMGWEEPAELSNDNAEALAGLLFDNTLIEYTKKISQLENYKKQELYHYIDFLYAQNTN